MIGPELAVRRLVSGYARVLQRTWRRYRTLQEGAVPSHSPLQPVAGYHHLHPPSPPVPSTFCTCSSTRALLHVSAPPAPRATSCFLRTQRLDFQDSALWVGPRLRAPAGVVGVQTTQKLHVCGPKSCCRPRLDQQGQNSLPMAQTVARAHLWAAPRGEDRPYPFPKPYVGVCLFLRLHRTDPWQQSYEGGTALTAPD